MVPSTNPVPPICLSLWKAIQSGIFLLGPSARRSFPQNPLQPVTVSPNVFVKALLGVMVGCLISPATISQSLGSASHENARTLTPEELNFFESKIRPLLVERCYGCHSSQGTLMGGLRLDTKEGWLAGGSRGPAIIPGQPGQSLLIKAINYKDPNLTMPPQGILPLEEIALLEQWVGLGAPDPRTREEAEVPRTSSLDLEEGRKFWSFQPLAPSVLPPVKDRDWIRSPLDYFILARLENEHLTPVAPAGRRTWLRRVTFDLLGLPPTPAEVEAFLEDRSPSAYETVVDRLLASPHYGERWARYWLDVARYAEEQRVSNVKQFALPFAYKYRDWVVAAFNQDLGYDQFIMQQIAGDLMPDLGPEGWSAVGFLSLGPIYQTDGGGEESKLRHRYDTMDDKMDTLSRGVLGLTVSCARCHDHKFDPIPTQDYYSLAGVFFNTKYVPRRWTAPSEDSSRYELLEALLKDKEKCVEEAKTKKIFFQDDEVDAMEKQQKVIDALSLDLEEFKKTLPPEPEHVHTLAESGSQDIPVAVRGDPVQPGEVVPRRFLQVLAGDQPPPFSQGSGRMELARSVASPSNPLTARVMVNRIWQHHFGQGLVRTPSNFGSMGEPPTHPLLLDWLARRFIDSGWSMKRLHREILLSATYRMSSTFDRSNFEIDGENRLLWRMNPRRLDVEAWRDGLLAVAGEQDLQIGGPPVEDILNSRRRTLYAPIRRDSRFPSDEFLRLFDFPSAWLSSSQRTVTTVPQQQLFLMNSEFMVARARAFIKQLSRLEDDAERIERTFQLVFSRPPSEIEKTLALDFLKGDPGKNQPRSLSRWEQYAQVLLGSNEFMHVR